MDNEKLNDILKDEDFMKEVLQSNSAEDFKMMFKNKGINLSDKDVEEIVNLVRYEVKKPMEECDLENVSGGKITSAKVRNIAVAISAILIAGSVGYLSLRAAKTMKKVDSTMDKLNCLRVRGLGSLFVTVEDKKDNNEKL